MSDLRAKTELRRTIEERWGDRAHTTEARGLVYVPPVTKGGMTDRLIEIAVEAAMGFIDHAWDEGFAAGVEHAQAEEPRLGWRAWA